MGIKNGLMGIKAANPGHIIKKASPQHKMIALAGNPNVGKSTVFNSLTGLNQHTGNWPGKTVSNALGYCNYENNTYIMVDIPGTYSLMAHSAEEEVARDFICFGNPDAVIVVCDATCLERNLNLVLQTIEITENVIVCVNLMDEAKRKSITVNLNELSERLGVPVVGTVAKSKKSLDRLMCAVGDVLSGIDEKKPVRVEYTEQIERAVSMMESVIRDKVESKINPRWLSLRLLDYDKAFIEAINTYLGFSVTDDKDISEVLIQTRRSLADNRVTGEILQDQIVSCIIKTAERLCSGVVRINKSDYDLHDRRIDRILTGKLTGVPIMISLLLLVFWLTISGANYPSKILSDGLFWLEDRLTDAFVYMGAPDWLHGAVVFGVYRVLAWVVSVMLPPMAIFFPMFTLLEDLGYLPRVAFNLDKSFKKCRACGKQALTMCMVDIRMRNWFSFY